jgi:hypothetical protein
MRATRATPVAAGSAATHSRLSCLCHRCWLLHTERNYLNVTGKGIDVYLQEGAAAQHTTRPGWLKEATAYAAQFWSALLCRACTDMLARQAAEYDTAVTHCCCAGADLG